MELTVDQALQKGIEAHKAGKVQEADRYYTAILKAKPSHPDANHNMGVLAVGVGKVEEALPFFKTALETNPNISQYWLSYIDALIKLERLDDAQAVFNQAKSNGAKGSGFDKIEKQLCTSYTKIPNFQEPSKEQLLSLMNLSQRGQYLDVLNETTKLLFKFSNSIILYNIIGMSHRGLGKLEEAIQAYQKALSIKPDYTDAYNNMGIALQDSANWKKLYKHIKSYLN